ncbi:MAG: pyruvate kinase [Cetobacterium sp.]|uniref:pyruvate kinase n=1 Tax=unclassified Cetobacterium TaxID=2630983 RepID=UPI00163C0A3C|nr:pyruvate kinase [Cetobacterium sp. 2A]MBC2855880.1 pyruvate kinase [Cetobacterium sp. 2A]
MRKSKIVCTIGPSCDEKEILEKLLKAGVDVVRFNFSHGNHESHKKNLDILKESVATTNLEVATLLDTKGPEIRTTFLEGGNPISLIPGNEIIVIGNPNFKGNSQKIGVTYEKISKVLKPDDYLLIEDGNYSLKVKKIVEDEVICEVIIGGQLGEQKGVNLPGVKIDLPILSEKDKEDLIFGCENGFDYIAASFVRNVKNVESIREFLDSHGGRDIKIISKIEDHEGLDNFKSILEASDGIMVARGDLGVNIPFEKVPLAQKYIIKLCNEVGKPVITATQMLESMIFNPRPTRAETTDVANAILDGTDAIMLSGETAKGKYPVETVEVMSKIAKKTDSIVKTKVFDAHLNPKNFSEKITRGLVALSEDIESKYIVVDCDNMQEIEMFRKYFPKAIVIALTDNNRLIRQLKLLKGVYSFSKEKFSLDEMKKLKGPIIRVYPNNKISIISGGENYE